MIDLIQTSEPHVRLAAARTLVQSIPTSPWPCRYWPCCSNRLTRPRRGAADGLTNLLQAAVQPPHQPEGGLRNQAGRRTAVSALNTILPAFQAGYVDNQVEVRQHCCGRALRTALLLYQLTTEPAKREGVDDTEIQYVQRQLEAERADLRPLLLGLRTRRLT